MSDVQSLRPEGREMARKAQGYHRRFIFFSLFKVVCSKKSSALVVSLQWRRPAGVRGTVCGLLETSTRSHLRKPSVYNNSSAFLSCPCYLRCIRSLPVASGSDVKVEPKAAFGGMQSDCFKIMCVDVSSIFECLFPPMSIRVLKTRE